MRLHRSDTLVTSKKFWLVYVSSELSCDSHHGEISVLSHSEKFPGGGGAIIEMALDLDLDI